MISMNNLIALLPTSQPHIGSCVAMNKKGAKQTTFIKRIFYSIGAIALRYYRRIPNETEVSLRLCTSHSNAPSSVYRLLLFTFVESILLHTNQLPSCMRTESFELPFHCSSNQQCSLKCILASKRLWKNATDGGVHYFLIKIVCSCRSFQWMVKSEPRHSCA